MNPAENPVPTEPTTADATPSEATTEARVARREVRRWWIKLFLQPLLFLACGAALLAGLGIAQKNGWIATAGGSKGAAASATGKNARYICPMMCTPPQSEPGRCPVCAMELVQAAAGQGTGGSKFLELDPVARRVANIQIAAVRSAIVNRKIGVIGELRYDEGTLKTISAYVHGRLERLYADYTGMDVKRGDELAELYSPRLYSSQVEFLLAKKSVMDSRKSTLRGVYESNKELYESARQRLIEFGMSKGQIERLEIAGKADSRLKLHSPISGTVIEKMAVEGQYVKEGQAIYKLADLSTVWLMLRLFPEDASAVRYGQKVEATVNSLRGRRFAGRVAFVDRHVDPKTRTVGVRVSMDNSDRLLRIGDYAKATIEVPMQQNNDKVARVYDPDLANKWVSPRHPHVIESGPGKCRVCGIDLVPAKTLGFTNEPPPSSKVLLVPRNAVLMAGNASVVYVETRPGRFEIRVVELGPGTGDERVILSGLKRGEHVALSGNFLIDSQMQLAGNPSLIDPTRATVDVDEAHSPEIIAALSKLTPEDRRLAEAQKTCPVTELRLGMHGVPTKISVAGKPVFICCLGCKQRLLDNPEKYLARLKSAAAKVEAKEGLPPVGPLQSMEQLSSEAVSEGLPPIGDFQSPETMKTAKVSNETQRISAALGKLAPADRDLARQQIICPVAGKKLGLMGVPRKVNVAGRQVFICCESCRKSLLAKPAKFLAKLPKEGKRK